MASFLTGLFFEDLPQLAASGSGCDIHDCMDSEKKKECPVTCGAADDMLDFLKTSGRNFSAKKVETQLVSRLQTLFEEEFKKLRGNANSILPDWMSEALIAFDGAIQGIVNGPPDTRAGSLHASDLGYPLTVIEALLFQFNLSSTILAWPRDTANGKLYLNFAKVCEKYGWNSTEAHEFYQRGIQFDDIVGPVDAGWIDDVFATLQLFLHDFGTHTYTNVPGSSVLDRLFGDLDYNFSVYSLPEGKDKPLKIGLVADWGTGTPQAIKVIEQLKKENVDMVLHLGDTYYSGTAGEARAYFLEPMRAVFGEKMPVLQVPGNHDYYSGGSGFFEVIKELGQQNASYFCLRGKHWQILAIDTGLLSSFDLNPSETTMTFLPDEQYKWATHQLKVGRAAGLKTIMMSHHQLFSRTYGMGVPFHSLADAPAINDMIKGTFTANLFNKVELPGGLPDNISPTVNTRLLKQFPAEVLEHVDIWFWGHEHSSAIFEPYAGLERGRCVGNSALVESVATDSYGTSGAEGTPWGGYPEVIPGSEIGHGDAFWNLGFVTIELDGAEADVKYFKMQDTYEEPHPPVWGDASIYWREKL